MKKFVKKYSIKKWVKKNNTKIRPIRIEVYSLKKIDIPFRPNQILKLGDNNGSTVVLIPLSLSRILKNKKILTVKNGKNL